MQTGRVFLLMVSLLVPSSIPRRVRRTSAVPPARTRRRADRALDVVDDHPRDAAAEPFEGAAVAAQPCRDALVADELGLLVTRPGQRHHEEPSLEDLTGVDVGDQGGWRRNRPAPPRPV